jgi:hypothetical protein
MEAPIIAGSQSASLAPFGIALLTEAEPIVPSNGTAQTTSITTVYEAETVVDGHTFGDAQTDTQDDVEDD